MDKRRWCATHFLNGAREEEPPLIKVSLQRESSFAADENSGARAKDTP